MPLGMRYETHYNSSWSFTSSLTMALSLLVTICEAVLIVQKLLEPLSDTRGSWQLTVKKERHTKQTHNLSPSYSLSLSLSLSLSPFLSLFLSLSFFLSHSSSFFLSLSPSLLISQTQTHFCSQTGAFTVTCIALNLGHLRAQLLGIPEQFLMESSGWWWLTLLSLLEK